MYKFTVSTYFVILDLGFCFIKCTASFWGRNGHFLYVQSAQSKKRTFLGETRKKQTVNLQFLGETATKRRNFAEKFRGVSRRNFSAFRGENGHHDLGIKNVFAAFRGKTKTVMT